MIQPRAQPRAHLGDVLVRPSRDERQLEALKALDEALQHVEARRRESEQMEEHALQAEHVLALRRHGQALR